MRRIVMFNQVSADGYFAAADGNLNWVVPDDELEKGAVDGMSDTDTMIFGRKTYDMFESFWPKALDSSSSTAPDPHAKGRRTAGTKAMAVWINETPKLVFSRSKKSVTWTHSRLLPELDPREIAAMKQQPGKDMIIFGSGSIVAQLTEHGLIDEYRFVVSPVLLGSGRTLLNGMSTSTKLELVESKAHESGTVMLRYARAH